MSGASYPDYGDMIRLRWLTAALRTRTFNARRELVAYRNTARSHHHGYIARDRGRRLDFGCHERCPARLGAGQRGFTEPVVLPLRPRLGVHRERGALLQGCRRRVSIMQRYWLPSHVYVRILKDIV